MLVVLSRQPEEGQGLFDGILGPASSGADSEATIW